MDYAPHTDRQVAEMLRTIGVERFEDLVADIPTEARCATFDVPPGLSELEVLRLCEELARPNRSLRELRSFLGFGAYQHAIPTAVDAVASRGEWLTPYTPYQAEASQGTLQMIYEFQTLVCELTGLEVANASLYDGASALAEAAVLALRSSPATGGSSGRSRLLVSETIHPHARQVIATYISGFPCTLQLIPARNGVTDLDVLKAALKDDVAAVLMQQPNVFGCLEPMAPVSQAAHSVGALFISSVYPVSLGVLTPPGAYGADIAVGEGRCLGSPVGYGGPGLGLMATTNALLRKIPGRLSGCTVDHAGRRAFTLTLQTREQQIRREKATSNICTSAGWLCVRATIFLSLLGAQGFKELARLNAQKAHEWQERLTAIPWIRPAFTQPFFNEFAVCYTDGRAPEAVNKALLKAGIIGGLALAPYDPTLRDAALWCATERISPDDMDRTIDVLRDL